MAKFGSEIDDFFPANDEWGDVIGYEFSSYDPLSKTFRAKLSVEEKHRSPSGMLHGGVTSAFVDWSMGMGALHAIEEKQFLSTIEFKINYLRPGKVGDRLIAEVQPRFIGRTHVVMQFRVHVDDGRDIAFGTGTYNLYNPKD